jgi:CheY-like chemotaxis protein
MAASPNPRRLRVLVVDDSEDGATSLAILLQLVGYDADVAFSGPAALKAVAGTRPDVVFCDLAMPGMDGYQVADRLRKAGPTRPVLVALTAYSSDEARRRARQAGFEHFLVKPADVQALLQLLGGLAGSLGLFPLDLRSSP